MFVSYFLPPNQKRVGTICFIPLFFLVGAPSKKKRGFIIMEFHRTNEYLVYQTKENKRKIKTAFVKTMVKRLFQMGPFDEQLRKMYDVWVADVSRGKFPIIPDSVTGNLAFTVKHGKLEYTFIMPDQFYWILKNTGL